MTEEELAAIERRAAAASPGPWLDGWDYDENEGHFILANTDGGELFSMAEVLPVDIFNPCHQVEAKHLRATADFIAAAREDIPALLAECRRLREQLRDIAKCATDVLAETEHRCERLAGSMQFIAEYAGGEPSRLTKVGE